MLSATSAQKNVFTKVFLVKTAPLGAGDMLNTKGRIGNVNRSNVVSVTTLSVSPVMRLNPISRFMPTTELPIVSLKVIGPVQID